jgi:hypothetical protein
VRGPPGRACCTASASGFPIAEGCWQFLASASARGTGSHGHGALQCQPATALDERRSAGPGGPLALPVPRLLIAEMRTQTGTTGTGSSTTSSSRHHRPHWRSRRQESLLTLSLLKPSRSNSTSPARSCTTLVREPNEPRRSDSLKPACAGAFTTGSVSRSGFGKLESTLTIRRNQASSGML